MKKILLWFPVVLWFCIFWNYFLGKPAMTRHGIDYYHIVKYQMDNLLRGVFPLWDPYLFWGRPDNIDVRFIGEFNPFLWLYAIFIWLGFSPPLAYLYYSTAYYFLGLAGFYLLARRVLGETVWATLAFALLLFSSLTIPIFNNFCIILLFVPVVWFFYFLTAFAQTPEKKFFLGLIFSSMLVLITYMPFYFLTILLCFAVCFGLFFWKEISKICEQWKKFFIQHKMLLCFGVVALGIAMIPGVIWYLNSEGGEYILSWRHAGAASANAASMDIGTINMGSLVGPVTIKGLFSNLAYSEALLFYVSVFIYIVLCLSIINSLNRKLWLFFVTGFFLCLIVLTDLTPVHRFLYDSFSIFRLFRNIFYLSYLAILPLLILFCLEQLRLFLETPLKTQKNRLAMAVFVVLAHLLFAAFLFRQGSIIITSYVTIFLSAVLFVLYFFQRSHREQPFFIIGLLIVILLQPAEVFYHYKNNAPGVVEWFPRDRFYPKFSFVRPVRREEINYFSYYKGRSPQALQDASGFESWKYTGLYRSYWLHENIQPDILENYVRHKFVVFDRTEHMDEKNWDFKKMETAFARRANVAFVSDPAAEPVPVPQNSPGGDQWQVITAPSDQFSVEAFDLNFIKLKTNFDSAKFFVYNDGYDRNWRASVNGRAAKIIKANYAFKGLWLPAGPNQIYLRYGSAWLYGFNIFMLVFYGAFFLYLLGLWLYPLRKGHKGT